MGAALATLLRPAAFSTNPFPTTLVEPDEAFRPPLRPGPIPNPSAPAARFCDAKVIMKFKTFAGFAPERGGHTEIHIGAKLRALKFANEMQF